MDIVVCWYDYILRQEKNTEDQYRRLIQKISTENIKIQDEVPEYLWRTCVCLWVCGMVQKIPVGVIIKKHMNSQGVVEERLSFQ